MMLIRKGTGEDPRLIEKDKVPYLEFEALKKQSWLTHAFSTRLGGVSEGIYTSMNLSFTRGDKEEAVQENYGRIAQCMGASKIKLLQRIIKGLETQWVLTGKKWSCPIRLTLQMYAL